MFKNGLFSGLTHFVKILKKGIYRPPPWLKDENYDTGLAFFIKKIGHYYRPKKSY